MEKNSFDRVISHEGVFLIFNQWWTLSRDSQLQAASRETMYAHFCEMCMFRSFCANPNSLILAGDVYVYTNSVDIFFTL